MGGLVFIEEHPLAGRVVRAADGATIGREGCDVLLADPEASRRHAILRAAGSGAAVEDLGSTNGTYVNGRRVDGTAPLSAGDRLRFGQTVWRLQR